MVKYFRRSTETERVCLSEGCNSIRWIQVKSKYSLSLAAPVRRKAAPHRTPFPTYTSCVLEMLVCSFSSSSSLYLTSSFALSPAECLGVFVLSLFFFSKAQNRLFLESFPFWRGAPQMEHTPRKVPPQSAPSRSPICFDRSGEELQQFAERRMGAVGGETCMQSQDESGSRAVEESPVAGASDEDESRVLREVTLGSDASAAAQRMMPPCGHAQKHISCYNTAKHMVSGEDFIAFHITQRWNEYSPLLKWFKEHASGLCCQECSGS